MTDESQAPGPVRQRLKPDTVPPAAAERPVERKPLTDPSVTPEPETPESETAVDADDQAALLLARSMRGGKRKSWLLRCLVAGLGLGLVALTAWLVDTAIASIGDGSALGLLTASAAGLVAIGVIGAIAGEFWTLSRLRSRENLRAAADSAIESGDAAAIDRTLAAMMALHGKRPELAWPLERYREMAADVPDAIDRLAVYERQVLGPLDEAAVAETRRLVRRCAVLTAVIPNPVLEAAVVLWLSLGTIRAVARVQGMRPGLLASGALVRQTATAIVAAGAMEAMHDLAPSAAAAGLAQRIAGRLGQGAINGFLTARLGVAALEATRPLPFRARKRPSAREILGKAVTG